MIMKRYAILSRCPRLGLFVGRDEESPGRDAGHWLADTLLADALLASCVSLQLTGSRRRGEMYDKLKVLGLQRVTNERKDAKAVVVFFEEGCALPRMRKKDKEIFEEKQEFG